ncbi:hypothetical protein RFI_00019, partial [Reticulomyxa filosa]
SNKLIKEKTNNKIQQVKEERQVVKLYLYTDSFELRISFVFPSFECVTEFILKFWFYIFFKTKHKTGGVERISQKKTISSIIPKFIINVEGNRTREVFGGGKKKGVGKTCLLLRFAEQTFQTSFISTIGCVCTFSKPNKQIKKSKRREKKAIPKHKRIDFKMKTVDIDGKTVKLQIWDTAGQDRFRAVTTAYYRGAMGIVLVYDITEQQSFQNVGNWIENIHEHASDDIPIVLVGNKCDKIEERVTQKYKYKYKHIHKHIHIHIYAKIAYDINIK